MRTSYLDGSLELIKNEDGTYRGETFCDLDSDSGLDFGICLLQNLLMMGPSAQSCITPQCTATAYPQNEDDTPLLGHNTILLFQVKHTHYQTSALRLLSHHASTLQTRTKKTKRTIDRQRATTMTKLTRLSSAHAKVRDSSLQFNDVDQESRSYASFKQLIAMRGAPCP